MNLYYIIILLTTYMALISCQMNSKDSIIHEEMDPAVSNYHGDTGDHVIFFEDFDSPDYKGRWRVHWSKAVGSGIIDSPSDDVFSGKHSAYFQIERGKHKSNGQGEYVPNIPIDDIAFVRVFLKLEEDFSMGTARSMKLFSIKGCRTIDQAYGQAGKRPNGRDRFSALVTLTRWGEPGVYFYHPEQLGRYGESAYCDRLFCSPEIVPGKWHCLELMLKANTPGKKNGAIKLWLDDDLIVWLKNLRLRDIPEVKIRRFAFTGYFGGGGIQNTAPKNQRFFIDNYTISRLRVGCQSSQREQ